MWKDKSTRAPSSRIASPSLADGRRVHLSRFGCRRCDREEPLAVRANGPVMLSSSAEWESARARGGIHYKIRPALCAWRGYVKDGSDGYDRELTSAENAQQLRGWGGAEALPEDRFRVQILQVSCTVLADPADSPYLSHARPFLFLFLFSATSTVARIGNDRRQQSLGHSFILMLKSHERGMSH